ncbi:MAG: hypothetical protein RIQ47_669 [Bacteroidota bacterium]|jgi:hypothetical protein
MSTFSKNKFNLVISVLSLLVVSVIDEYTYCHGIVQHNSTLWVEWGALVLLSSLLSLLICLVFFLIGKKLAFLSTLTYTSYFVSAMLLIIIFLSDTPAECC